MIRDEQAHSIPAEAADRARLSLNMGLPDWPAAAGRIDAARGSVARQFDALLFGAADAQRRHDDLGAVWLADEGANIGEELERGGFPRGEIGAVAATLDVYRRGAAYRRLDELGRRRVHVIVARLLTAAAKLAAPAGEAAPGDIGNGANAGARGGRGVGGNTGDGTGNSGSAGGWGADNGDRTGRSGGIGDGDSAGGGSGFGMDGIAGGGGIAGAAGGGGHRSPVIVLALLKEQPAALDRLIDVCAISGFLAGQIADFPLLLDELIDAKAFDELPSRQGFVQALAARTERLPSDDPERQVESLRQFQKAAVFSVALADLTVRLPLMRVSEPADRHRGADHSMLHGFGLAADDP